MLELEINGNRVGLNAGTKISVDKNSPFEDRESLKTQYSYPFEIPLSEAVKAEIAKYGNQHDYQNVSFPFKLYNDGVLVEEGFLKLGKKNENLNTKVGRIQTQLTFNSSAYADLIGEKKVNELKMDGIRTIHFDRDSNDFYPIMFALLAPDPVAGIGAPTGTFPVFYDSTMDVSFLWGLLASTAYYATNIVIDGDDYIAFMMMETQIEGNTRYINGWDRTYNRMHAYVVQNNYLNAGYHINNYESSENLICPMYYKHQVLKHCFSEFGYELSGELLLNEDFKKEVLANAYSILKETLINVHAGHDIQQWSVGLGADIGDTIPKDTDWNILYFQDSTKIDPKNHLPDYSIKEFLNAIMIQYNVMFVFNGNKVSMVPNKLDQLTKQELPQEAYIIPDLETEYPDKRGVKIFYDFDSSDKAYEIPLKYNTVGPTIKAEGDDESIVSALIVDDKFIIRNLNSIQLTTVAGTTSEQYTDNIIGFVTGSEKELSCKLSAVTQKVILYPSGDLFVPNFKILVPVTRQSPSYKPIRYWNYELITFGSTAFGTFRFSFRNLVQAEEDFSSGDGLVFSAFYHGLTYTLESEALEFVYPYGSNHNYRPLVSGQDKLGSYHLGWLGDEGLIETFYKNFVRVFVGDKVNWLIKAPYWWVKSLRHDESILIRGREYYISAVKYEQPYNGKVLLETIDIS